MLYAIDPGPTQSAIVSFRDGRVMAASKEPNADVIDILQRNPLKADHLAVEMIASYGMAVGAEVFDTCVVIGRFLQAWRGPSSRVFRKDVKLNLCGVANAKDTNIRRALIDRYGPGDDLAIGKKNRPGPLYGINGDQWAALAVAVTWCDMNKPTPAAAG